MEKSVGKNQKLESWLVCKAFSGKGYRYRKANIIVGNINCSWKGTIQIYHSSIGIFSTLLDAYKLKRKLANFEISNLKLSNFTIFQLPFPTMCKSCLPLNFRSSKIVKLESFKLEISKFASFRLSL